MQYEITSVATGLKKSMGTLVTNSLSPQWMISGLSPGQTWGNCTAMAFYHGDVSFNDMGGPPINDVPGFVVPRSSQELQPADATVIGRHILGHTWSALLDAAQVVPNNLVTDVGEFSTPFPLEEVSRRLIEIEKNVVPRERIEEDPNVHQMVEDVEHFLSLLETQELEYKARTGFKRFLNVKKYTLERQNLKEEALEKITELNEYANDRNYDVGRAHALFLFGQLYNFLGQHQDAVDFYTMAISAAQKTAYFKLESEIEFCLAASYKAVGEPRQAVYHANKGFFIPDTPYEARVQALLLFEEAESMGDHPDKWTTAIKYYEQAADLFFNYARKQTTRNKRDFTEDEIHAITCNTRIAYLYLEHENVNEARDYFERALKDSDVVQDPEIKFDILHALFDICWQQGDYWQALDYHHDATEVMSQFDPEESSRRHSEHTRLKEHVDFI